MSNGRIIGIVHRVKFTVDGEPRPTMVAIADASGKMIAIHTLETETDELDFLLGRFSVKYEAVKPNDDLSGLLPRQIKWQKAESNEAEQLPASHVIVVEKKTMKAVKKPVVFEGLRFGDMVVMTLGGSGDRFAYAINNYGQSRGIKIVRIQPADLKDQRQNNKDQDHLELVSLYLRQPKLFHGVTERDSALIRIKFAFDMRMESMKARIACGQRLEQRLIGKIFLSSDGHYPDGCIEDILEEEKVNDETFQALVREEERRNKELKSALKNLDIYKKLFGDIIGFGPRISAPLLAYIGDIRRFETPAKFKMFCGVAPSADGQFVRKKRGQRQSWRPEVRQALFLFADQCNRRPDSEWGQRLLEIKTRLREKYPDVIVEERSDPENPDKIKKVKLYTPGHIQNKARWHLLGQFCEELYYKWMALYQDESSVVVVEVDSVDDSAVA